MGRPVASPAGPCVRGVIAMAKDFNERGVNVQSLTEEISTTTPGVKLTFHIFAALLKVGRTTLYRTLGVVCPTAKTTDRALFASEETPARSRKLSLNSAREMQSNVEGRL
jgi:hypothetical protein